MVTDSAVSWGVLLLITLIGFIRAVKAVADADEKMHGGGSDVW